MTTPHFFPCLVPGCPRPVVIDHVTKTALTCNSTECKDFMKFIDDACKKKRITKAMAGWCECECSRNIDNDIQK